MGRKKKELLVKDIAWNSITERNNEGLLHSINIICPNCKRRLHRLGYKKMGYFYTIGLYCNECLIQWVNPEFNIKIIR